MFSAEASESYRKLERARPKLGEELKTKKYIGA